MVLPSAGPVPRPIEGPGSVIGRYKLLEQVGEGGFGVGMWPNNGNRSNAASRSRSSSWDGHETGRGPVRSRTPGLAMMDIRCGPRRRRTERAVPFSPESVRGIKITGYATRIIFASGTETLWEAACSWFRWASIRGVLAGGRRLVAGSNMRRKMWDLESRQNCLRVMLRAVLLVVRTCFFAGTATSGL